MKKFEKLVFHLPLWGESTTLSHDALRDDSSNGRMGPLERKGQQGFVCGCLPGPLSWQRAQQPLTPESCSSVLSESQREAGRARCHVPTRQKVALTPREARGPYTQEERWRGAEGVWWGHCGPSPSCFSALDPDSSCPALPGSILEGARGLLLLSPVSAG